MIQLNWFPVFKRKKCLMLDWTEIKYFKSHEFDSPDMPSSGKQMNLPFIKMLDELREKLDFPLIINSGFRTASHNTRIGGAYNSAHLRGKAADIKCLDSGTRFKIVKEALKLGFLRVEIAPKHIHLDNDASLPQEIMVHLASY